MASSIKQLYNNKVLLQRICAPDKILKRYGLSTEESKHDFTVSENQIKLVGICKIVMRLFSAIEKVSKFREQS